MNVICYSALMDTIKPTLDKAFATSVQQVKATPLIGVLIN